MVGTVCLNSISVLAQPLPQESQKMNINATKIAQRASYGKVTANNVHFRATPSLSGSIIATLSKGTEVMYTTSSNNVVTADGYKWREVEYNNKTGWIATIYLEEAN